MRATLAFNKLATEERRALRELKTWGDIIISKANKRGGSSYSRHERLHKRI